MARTPVKKHKDLLIWQWNSNGYNNKRAVLQQHIQHLNRPPDVILIQETHSETPPTLPGYRTHASPPSARDAGKGVGRGVCALIRKGITFIEHDILGRSAIEHCAIELVTGTKKRKESTIIVNVYSNPAHRQQKFRALIHKTLRQAQHNTVLLCGDFNAPHQDWGYLKTTTKGRDLIDDATDAGFHLLTDPTDPTRIGTSITRDTTPDLTFVRPGRNGKMAQWLNTGRNLGSDHFIIEITLPTNATATTPATRTQRITDWNTFRQSLEASEDIDDIEAWSRALAQATEAATTDLETDDSITQVDSRLAHLIEAKQSIQQRWRRQRTNRKLRKKVALLNKAIEQHSKVLCRQQWHAVCQEADGQMHKSRTWQLLRFLLDETKSKGEQRHCLARTLQKAIAELGEQEVCRRLNDRYLPTAPVDNHPEYAGLENADLDKDIEEWEVRAVLQTLNSRSAAGPDKVTNKALRNLSDAAITALTRYFNTCWRNGRLPRQWKTAKTVLLPKQGKPPHIDNLRPISLTSCVGKVLEHVLLNRWQRYLEGSALYPNTIIGFRAKLSTQEAMLLLKHEIIDDPTRTLDNRAVLGLDLQSAFDRLRHAAILEQVSHLNMGSRTYAYIRDFLTDRTTAIHAGDLQLPQKSLGSVGTPQGSVISPLLFNLVMIGVATELACVPGVGHTIYADDITLWVAGGSDGHIEDTLQKAVTTIETRLQGTGLVCSPSKSELLIIPPRHARTKVPAPANITIRTMSGSTIPHVRTLRVLGMLLDSRRSNCATVTKITAKVAAAMRLIRRVATRRTGMKEDSLTRLVHSFAISHIAYVAAYHNWTAAERAKLDATIRKAYKAALGLLQSTSTDRLLELGVHNTLDEIIDAQRTAQYERLSQTRTGRSILQTIGVTPLATQPEDTVPLPATTARRFTVSPIPKHMHPEHNSERRLARARALTTLYANDRGAKYVDAAAYPHRPGTYAAVVVDAVTGVTRSAGSFAAADPHQAEEMAIALAMVDPTCTTVLSDSRTAVLRYATNTVSASAVRVLSATHPPTTPVTLRWFPAHAGPLHTGAGLANRNETADAAARALTLRAADDDATSTSVERAATPECAPITRYGDILAWHRHNRRTRPPPHPRLSRKEAVLYRQLQTGSLLTPVLGVHVCPEIYQSDVCRVCESARATMAHILWDCELHPHEAATQTQLPPNITEGMISSTYDSQLRAVQQVEAALERQMPLIAPAGSGHTPGPAVRGLAAASRARRHDVVAAS